jgi:hypothetical protein
MSGGTWSLSEGPLVTLEIVGDGVRWIALDGSTVETVYVEHAATTTPEANVGSATLSLGGDSGTVEAPNDSDLLVVFTGTLECGSAPGMDVHEDPVTAFITEAVPAEPPPVPSGAFASARITVSLPWVLMRGLAEFSIRGV